MFRMSGALSGSALVLILGIAGPTAQASVVASEVPPGPVTIDVEAIHGSGCKPKETTATLSPDKQALTVLFAGYTVEQGKDGANPPNKNCKIMLNLRVPAGYSQGIVQADYRGFAQLSAGTQGALEASYFFRGNSDKMKTYSPLKGPFEDNFTFTDSIPMGNVVWSPCGKDRPFGINTAMRLSKSPGHKGYSMMTMDSADVSTRTTLKFVWRKC